MNKGLQKGMTLLELMMVIAIIGIVAALGLPSFTDTIERARVRSGVEDAMYLFANAYSEAVKLGRLGNVIIDMNDPDPKFSNSWVVKDLNAPNTVDAVTGVRQDILYSVDRPVNVELDFVTPTIQVASKTYKGIQFLPNGMVTRPFELTVCTTSKRKSVGRVINLRLFGKAVVDQDKVDCPGAQ